jgi:Ras-related protein Rab-5C
MGGCVNKSKQETPKQQNFGIKLRNESSSLHKEENKPIVAKVVLLGDQNVGKSSIAQRFCKNLFTGQYVVTVGGAYFQQKLILGNGSIIKFHIWDTGGHERFRSMANLYYHDASAAILTYDVSNEKSYESLNYWIEELKNKVDKDKLVLCLAGNKCDREVIDKKVHTLTAKNFAEINKMQFFETSAKDDIGIKELFQSLAKKIYENQA